MSSWITTFNDDVLIERALAGQADCFSVLMDRHKVAVRRRVRSMLRNPADEDDLVQQAFLKAWRHLASFRAEASFRTWLTQIAANEVMQLYRRERSSPICPALADLDSFASRCESPHQSLERVEARQAVRNAVAKLPEKYREILILRDLQQLTAQETGRRLQIGVPLVKTRLFRARLLLSSAVRRQHHRASPREAHAKAAA